MKSVSRRPGNLSSISFKKILLVNPFGIGDAIFSMYLAEAIKRNWPQVEIGFMGNERTIELLRMNRSIDVCHKFNRDEFRGLRFKNPVRFVQKIFNFAGEIKKEHYDLIFDLSLGREFSFAAACIGIRRRIGFDFKNRGRWLTQKTSFAGYEKKHVVDWQLDLLRHLGLEWRPVSSRLPLFVSDTAKKKAFDFLARQGVKDSTVFFTVAPGGGKSWGTNASYKQWAPAKFAKVINEYARGSGATALILGEVEEKALLNDVKSALTVPAVLAADQSLEVAAALIERSRFLLCNDGGLLHLANALGVKTVSIYGPVDENVYGPYGADSIGEVLTQAVWCRPCYQKFYFPPCLNQRRCLEELSVEKVSAALQKI